eukprot:7821609-Pyramimonas_sp.AAC.1
METAWKTALRWMTHVQRERYRLRTLVSRLQSSNVLCTIEPQQCAVLLRAFHEVSGFLANVMRSRLVLNFLPAQLLFFFCARTGGTGGAHVSIAA